MKEMIHKLKRKLFFFFFNNIIFNHILIVFKKDAFIKNWQYNWNTYVYDETKTAQQNVGCSSVPLIEALVSTSHRNLKQTVSQYAPSGNILDLGCGTAMFLADFDNSYRLYGIDMNAAFLDKAKELVPSATYFKGNYLNFEFSLKFNFIYCFSVFQYIERSKLDIFFYKIANDLETKGIFYLQYPHAVRRIDLLYPDLSYIKYSPHLIEKIAGKYLKIITHQHYYDNRKVNKYDKAHYYFPNAKGRTDTVQNTYLLIAQKF